MSDELIVTNPDEERFNALEQKIEPTPEEQKRIELFNVAMEGAKQDVREWRERKRRISKRLKKWRRIVKHENLRPGQSITSSSGGSMAHFVRWHPDNGMLAIIDIWGSATERYRDYSIFKHRNPTPTRPGRGSRVLTIALDYRNLRVVR
jgi:hypothetical protein